MQHDNPIAASPRYKAVTRANVSTFPQWEKMDADLREAVEVVSAVLPFRVNEYVMNELIDWDAVPNDPIFQLTFPQRGMLEDDAFVAMRDLIRSGAEKKAIDAKANEIRLTLNPHPAGQMTDNVPRWNGEALPGCQHKYRETVLFFPSHGQTCHAYCTFCFRWAQFVGIDDLKFAAREVETLKGYLRENKQVSDVLFTGGDPMIMKTKFLEEYLGALLEPGLEHISTIRIGTKSVGYWPQRFVTDSDADDVLRLFEKVVASGKQISIMGHYSHPVELEPEVSKEAVRRIRSTGANIRMQSPVIRHVNDDPEVWTKLWKEGTRLGMIPYYMFVERDTGARSYFEMPLVQAWNIFRHAYQDVSGVSRTVRGPSMSAHPGKCHVLGVQEVAGKKVFVLEYLQARQHELVRRPFFAAYDAHATWFDQLQPAFESDLPFFPHLKEMPAPRRGAPTAPLRG